MAKSTTPRFSLDPYNNPLPSIDQPEEDLVQKPSPAASLSLSPFKDTGDQPIPDQEVCLMAFPVPTYKAISDEATKRGLTMAQAVQQAFNLWFSVTQNR